VAKAEMVFDAGKISVSKEERWGWRRMRARDPIVVVRHGITEKLECERGLPYIA